MLKNSKSASLVLSRDFHSKIVLLVSNTNHSNFSPYISSLTDIFVLHDQSRLKSQEISDIVTFSRLKTELIFLHQLRLLDTLNRQIPKAELVS